MSQRIKQIAAFVLLATAAALLWHAIGPSDGAIPRIGRSDAPEADEPELPTIQDLRLSLLQARAAEYDPRGRNLFQYTTPPPSPEELARREAERQRRLEEQRRQREEEERKRREAAEAARRARLRAQEEEEKQQEQQAAPAVPQPPEIRLTYVGFIGPQDERVAVMLDPEGELVVGKEGEVIQDEFRILRIGYTFLEMGYVKFEGSKPLPLESSGGGRG